MSVNLRLYIFVKFNSNRVYFKRYNVMRWVCSLIKYPVIFYGFFTPRRKKILKMPRKLKLRKKKYTEIINVFIKKKRSKIKILTFIIRFRIKNMFSDGH